MWHFASRIVVSLFVRLPHLESRCRSVSSCPRAVLTSKRMSRRSHAWTLLVALTLSGMPSIVALATRWTSKSGSPLLSCCSGSNCPMRKRSSAVPDCSMGSQHKHSPASVKCTCSVSRDGSSAILNSHVDFRFDLPTATLLPELAASWTPFTRNGMSLLPGHASPPDQPPRALRY